MNQITAQVLESEIQIVHAVPGRVRLRNTSSRLISALETIAQQLRKQDGVGEVRMNPTTNTLVVTFDAIALSLPQMLEILQRFGVSQASALPREAENTQAPQVPKLDSFWSEETDFKPSFPKAQSLIPMISGMLVTGGLGIQGWMALPVYAIAESVTRELIKQVEEEAVASPEGKTQEKAVELNGKSVAINGNRELATQQPEVAYSAVHEIPGRIRFRVPRISEDAEYSRRLEVLAETDPKVTNIRINRNSASVAFSYEADGISQDAMRSHLVHLIQSATTVILPPALKAEQQPEEQSQSWHQLAMPAISATLALLGGPMGLPIPPALIGGSIAIAALPVAQRAFEA